MCTCVRACVCVCTCVRVHVYVCMHVCTHDNARCVPVLKHELTCQCKMHMR